MLIAHFSDPHIKGPGQLAYKRVDTAKMLINCVTSINQLNPLPDLAVITGDLVDLGSPAEYVYLKKLLAPLRMPYFVIPGNHDKREAFRDAFLSEGYLPVGGFLNFVVEIGGINIIGLDTIAADTGGGELCANRLAWLDETLSMNPEKPALILMHHPPFVTGIGHMDRLGLRGKEDFTAIMARHAQVKLILCGHLHRTIYAQVGGRTALTCPGPAHQVALDLREEAPSCFRMEPPGFLLHYWREEKHYSLGDFISHVAAVGDYAGPFPFFNEDGSLID